MAVELQTEVRPASSANKTGRPGYLPALDGARAVAIAAVVAYHLNPSLLPGGYLGVDVFFVLSGFLITRLLLAERLATGRIELRRFWSRRAKRLLPGLFLVVGSLAIVSMIIPESINPYLLRGDGLAAVFYFANWHFLVANQSYFATVSLPSPLEHTWTLSIEEQFYVVWPLLLLLLMRIVRHRGRVPHDAASATSDTARLFLPVAILAAASIGAMVLVYNGGRGLEGAYFGTECRAFELLVGALAAIGLWSRASSPYPSGTSSGEAPRRAVHILLRSTYGAIGLGGLLAAFVFATPGSFIFEGGLALVALATAAFLVSGIGKGPIRWVLSLSPLRFIGRISYEIYLWHWPVIIVADHTMHTAGAPRALFDIVVTLVLSVGSYYLIDSPLRRARFATPLRRIALPASLLVTCALLIAAVPLWTSAQSRSNTVASGPKTSLPPDTTSSVFGVTLPAPTGHIALGFTPSKTHKIRILYIGDSVMDQLELAIGAGVDSSGDATMTQGAILAWNPRGAKYLAEVTQEVKKARPSVVVAMWTHDNVWLQEHGIPAYERIVLAPLLKILLAPRDGVTGVVFVGQPPQPPPNSFWANLHSDVYDPVGMQQWEQAARDESRSKPGRVAFIPATKMLELNGQYSTWLPSPQGVIARVRQTDDFHLCLDGGIRYGAGAVLGLRRLFALPPPAPQWWLGSFTKAKRWYQLGFFPPGMCPADAPNHLDGAPG
ncbi:MAG: acyltransferase family protein [Acidimicrobiales bacterium]